MATYQVTAPDGRTVRLTGDAPPTEADLDEIFASLPKPKESGPLYGGADAQIGPGEEEGILSRLRRSYFGDPDRADAKAAGIGLTPTPSEMVQGAGMIAAPGSPAVASGLGAIGAGGTALAGNVPLAAAELALSAVPGGHALRKLGLLARLANSVRRAAPVAEEAAPVAQSALSAAEQESILNFMRGASAGAPAAAPVVADAAPAVTEAAPAVERAYQGIPSLMKIGREAEVGAEVAGQAAKGAEGAKSILKNLSPRPVKPIPPTKAATETADALVPEIEAKIIRLKTGIAKGLSADQIADSVREIYKVSDKQARSIVNRVFKERGF